MPETLRIPSPAAPAPSVGDPAYSLLGLAAGTLLQVGTRATTSVSTLTLASQGHSLGAIA